MNLYIYIKIERKYFHVFISKIGFVVYYFEPDMQDTAGEAGTS